MWLVVQTFTVTLEFTNLCDGVRFVWGVTLCKDWGPIEDSRFLGYTGVTLTLTVF